MLDRASTGVETRVGELLAQADDLILDLGQGAVGDPLSDPRARSDRLVAPGLISPDQLGDPALGDPVASGYLPIAASL